MLDEIYKKLSPKEVHSGLMHCWKSAKEHRECAKLMSARGSYGIANSHLILGAEEAIKAFILLRRYVNLPIELESVSPYFRDHKTKHEMADELSAEFLAGRTVLDIFNMIISAVAAITKKTSPTDFSGFIIPMMFGPSVEEARLWWKAANQRKNDGFYVDLSKEGWKAPSAVTEEEYRKSEKHVARIYAFLEICHFIEDDFHKYLPE